MKDKTLFSVLLILLILTIIFCQGCIRHEENPVLDSNESSEPEQQDGEEDEEEVGYTEVEVIGDKLAIRKTPGTSNKPSGDVIERARKGQLLVLINKHDDKTSLDGYIWWEVYNPTTGAKGWSASKYLFEFKQDFYSDDITQDEIKKYVEETELWIRQHGMEQLVGSMYNFYHSHIESIYYDIQIVYSRDGIDGKLSTEVLNLLSELSKEHYMVFNYIFHCKDFENKVLDTHHYKIGQQLTLIMEEFLKSFFKAQKDGNLKEMHRLVIQIRASIFS